MCVFARVMTTQRPASQMRIASCQTEGNHNALRHGPKQRNNKRFTRAWLISAYWHPSSSFRNVASASSCAPTRRCNTEADALDLSTVQASAPNNPKPATTTTRRTSERSAPSPGGGSPDPESDPSTNDSYQIGLDPFTQQLILSALTAGAAWALATWAHLDLTTALRPDLAALPVALELSAPVLVLLAAVLLPRWAPPFKGSELERLQHNYYMTAQVLQLYFDDDEDDKGEGDSSGREGEGDGWTAADGSGAGGERDRVRRRLRLEQTVGWGTVSSGLALLQAFTLQPWNPPTPNSVFNLGLAGRTAQQLANEFLVRGACWGLLSSWVGSQLAAADTSDGILFYGKVFGGPEAVKYAAGLALVAAAVPGALWQARAARNFVRASVVGPVRDAAIFCTGNGVDEPAYCDPAGFAMAAARRPANAAPVADVVTRTRGWRSGPDASFSSVSSLGSIDTADMEHQQTTTPASTTPVAPTSTEPGTPSVATSSHAAASTSGSSSTSSSSSSSSSPTPTSTTAAATPPPSSPGPQSTLPPPSSPPPAPTPLVPPALAGPRLVASSTAFEWDSEDMAVLLKVETLQDKIAFWASLYFQLLAAFAINGAFLASDCNLAASAAAAWLLRTGPLLSAELRARAAVDAAMRG